MSRYVTRIVLLDGVERFLVRGRLTDNADAATHYPHPSNACRAAEAFKRAHPGRLYTDVIDSRDPERIVR